MRKVILYIAMSLDGYIADKNGGVDWLQGDGSEEHHLGSYENFMEKVDSILLGYNTYEQIVTKLSPHKWVYVGKQSYVLTRKNLENKAEITFTAEDLTSLITRLKAMPGKDIWVCGGASIINQLIKLNLIDEYTISIIPTILGDGIMLFDKYEHSRKLKLKSTNHYNGIVDLIYSYH